MIIKLQMNEEETEEEAEEEKPEEVGTSLYKTRSGESSHLSFRRTSVSVDKSLLSNTTGQIAEDMIELKHLSLTSRQQVLFHAYHLLRTIAIDLRLNVLIHSMIYV